MSLKRKNKAMVSKTFRNLPSAKKERIDQALLTEFSTHKLASAQVARIVQNADIARGAFYKYFTDLSDAYRYLFIKAIKQIHTNIRPNGKYSATLFYQQVQDFLNQVQDSKYLPLIKMHFAHNEQEMPVAMNSNFNLTAANWAAMVLSHEVIKMVLLNPREQASYLDKFKQSLLLLAKGENK